MAFSFVTPETQVNTTTTGNQRAPATALLPSGRYITVWASDTGDGSGKSIRAQIFNSDGSKFGSEFLVNTTTAGDQDLPDVVYATGTFGGAGSIFVVWQSAEAAGSVIRARRFSESGDPRPFNGTGSSTPDVVLSGEAGGTKPSAGNFPGRAAFVWEAPSGDGDGTAIMYAIWTAGNFSTSAPTVLNTTTAGDQVDPQIDGATVVWESREPSGDVIRKTTLSASGAQSDVIVAGQGVTEDESLPNVSPDGVVVWNSGTSTKSTIGTLSETPGGILGRSDLVRLNDGTYVAVYATQSGDGDSHSIRVERISQGGVSLSSEVLVPQTFGVNEAPTIVLLENNNIVITWASADESGNFEIKQRTLKLSTVIHGTTGNDTIVATADNDLIYLTNGGDDAVSGLTGNDFFIYGAAMTSADRNNGGDGGSDAVLLQGDYSSQLVLGAHALESVEGLLFASGSDTRFGQMTPTNRYSYNVATVDENVAGGARLTVNGSTLLPGENMTFNGSAETNGTFLVSGGKGIDIVTGGQMNDMFFFGDENRWGPGDKVNGGAGFDGMILRGVYSGASKVSFASDSLTSVEAIGLNSVSDFRFDPGVGSFSYDLTLAEGNVGETGNLIVNGFQLSASELMTVDGSAIVTGSLSLYGGGGDDVLKGGANADVLRGNGGGDDLTGGGGADSFQFWAVADSSVSNPDRILDFASGTDKIDLTKIDANAGSGGDQAFSFIGSNAFSANSAGELRAYELNGVWYIEGDVDGGGADFVIEVVSSAPLSAGDFLF